MVAQAVEWVMVVHYGPEAHRATYGRRVRGEPGKYTKDFIQLHGTPKFLGPLKKLFAAQASAKGVVPLTYRWPTGSAPGELVFKSADRPHLKWATSKGAPPAWKMTPSPNDGTAETMPGDPSHTKFADAEKEFALLASRGAGQPYLMAIKLRDEPSTLHLRAYLGDPSKAFAWASLSLVPKEIQALAAKTTQKRAIASSLFPVDGTDLFFDPTQNHNAWSAGSPSSKKNTASGNKAAIPEGDAAAEALETDSEEVKAFSKQIAQKSYEVADSITTIKTRGSAQKAFADAVKANYAYRCAITGVATRDFLVASHIVPWSVDQSIRLDPSNGICLSLIVDRAFEKGYLQIKDDLTIQIDQSRLGKDKALRSQLEPYDGKTLSAPAKEPPKPKYLRRRRKLVASVK